MPTERRTKFAGGRKALLPTEPLPVVAQISHNGRSRQTAEGLSSSARIVGQRKLVYRQANLPGGERGMPYRKRGKYYWHKGRRYTLGQIRAIHRRKKR